MRDEASYLLAVGGRRIVLEGSAGGVRPNADHSQRMLEMLETLETGDADRELHCDDDWNH